MYFKQNWKPMNVPLQKLNFKSEKKLLAFPAYRKEQKRAGQRINAMVDPI